MPGACAAATVARGLSRLLRDAKAIGAEIRDVEAISPEIRTGNQVLANGLNWGTTILGEGEDYLSIRQWPLSSGAMFSEQDVRGDAKVCVIGQTIVNNLFPDGDPVGKTLRIRNLPFKVVGVLAAKGFSLQGTDQDDLVIVPYTSAMKRIARQNFLRTINVQADDPAKMAVIEQDITNLLRDHHHINEGRDDDFNVRDQQEIAEAATATTKTLTLLIAVIAGVSLIVGGIGIMNIMLVSVTERTREIGIRMAVGAHGKDIRMQFLIEALVLSLMGGTIGILFGVTASKLLALLYHWHTLVSPGAVIISFFSSGAVGILSGILSCEQSELTSTRSTPFDTNNRSFFGLHVTCRTASLSLKVAPMRFVGLILVILLTVPLRAGPVDDARDLYKAGKYHEAEEALTKLAVEDPKNAEVAYYMGMVMNAQKRYAHALSWLERAVSLAPENEHYLADFGGNALEQADRENSYSLATKGRDAMIKAVSMDPEDLDARDGLMQFYARAPWPLGDKDKAREQISEIAKRDPVRGLVAEAFLAIADKRYPDAISLCKKALAKKPADYDGLYQLGRATSFSGLEIDLGIMCLKRCLTLTPTGDEAGPSAVQSTAPRHPSGEERRLSGCKSGLPGGNCSRSPQ